ILVGKTVFLRWTHVSLTAYGDRLHIYNKTDVLGIAYLEKYDEQIPRNEEQATVASVEHRDMLRFLHDN
ncbi:hypothetical protein ACJX0J_010547, partial [Zea mays]